MGPEEETVDEALQRKRDLLEEMQQEIRVATRRIEAKYSVRLKEIQQDIEQALLRNAFERAMAALSTEDKKKVLGI